MKILYISKSILPSRTANSIHVMKMCQAFSDNGHEVILITPDQKNKYEKDVKNVFEYYDVKKNFDIKRLYHPNFIGGAFFYTLAIFVYLFLNKKSDLVYGRFLHGCYVATILKNDVIFETHEIIDRKIKNRFFFFKKLIQSKYFKKLIVISDALKNIYLKKSYLNSDKIQVAHDGADEVKDFDNKINLMGNTSALKVGYVGHLYKGRGIEMIIECAKKISDMTFHIVGGTQKDVTYWKNYTDKFLIPNIFFYGFVNPKVATKYRNSFDILLAPYANKVSIHGGNDSADTSKFMSPLKIFEYMSHKKAIIASDLPVLREILNSENSFLVKPESIDELVNAISLLKKKENREKFSTKAYSDFKKFTWKKRAEKVVTQF